MIDLSFGGVSDASYNYQQPATGFTLNVNLTDWHVLLDPAGTLATGTINLPTAVHDGQIINVRTSKTITALTVNATGGQSVVTPPSTLSAGKAFEALFRLANTTWYVSS